MASIIHLFILIPLLGFLLSLLLSPKKEAIISRSAFLTVGLQLLI